MSVNDAVKCKNHLQTQRRTSTSTNEQW